MPLGYLSPEPVLIEPSSLWRLQPQAAHGSPSPEKLTVPSPFGDTLIPLIAGRAPAVVVVGGVVVGGAVAGGVVTGAAVVAGGAVTGAGVGGGALVVAGSGVAATGGAVVAGLGAAVGLGAVVTGRGVVVTGAGVLVAVFSPAGATTVDVTDVVVASGRKRPRTRCSARRW